jgi:hypothetical protein
MPYEDIDSFDRELLDVDGGRTVHDSMRRHRSRRRRAKEPNLEEGISGL